MKLREMIERIQMHHPQMGDKECVAYLNQAMDDFSAKTKMVIDEVEVSCVADQRLYRFQDLSTAPSTSSKYLLEAQEVYLKESGMEYEKISRLLTKPSVKDVEH
jgi:hypothetical protein